MSVTSPLTSARSISTPTSYETGRNSSHEADITGISSPVADDCFKGPRYRPAERPVRELSGQCNIQLEEELYLPTILLLDNLLTDGTAPLGLKIAPPGRVPPPPQLAFLNTLTIHPSYTSRSPNTTNLHVAARALAFLRGVLELAGPVNANFRSAFIFRRPTRYRESRRGARYDSSPCISSYSSSDTEGLEGRLANEQSIWRRGTDFWSVLGWAFRCASSYPERWRHWQVWLEYMVQVLEKDWDDRKAMDLNEEGIEEGQESPDWKWLNLRESLLVIYLEDLKRDRKDVLKEVMRALMAFTVEDTVDSKVYQEVFERELAPPPGKSKRKRAATAGEPEPEEFKSLADWALDEDFGSEDEDEGIPGSPTPRRRTTIRIKTTGRKPGRPRITTSPKAQSFKVSDSMTETVLLRLRLFRLLSAAAAWIPDLSFQVDDLYHTFTERVCTAPLPMFRVFIDSLPFAYNIDSFIHVSLLRHFAEKLLTHKRPDPEDIEPDIKGGIPPMVVAKCFLPYAADRVMVEENAKVSLVLDSMAWYIYRNAEEITPEEVKQLGSAVGKGIKAREDKIKKRNAGLTAADREAREILDRSTRSLRVFVQVLEASR
ncbi:hypothetical protein QBC34DRAFT_442931 [Podospora aff. communis PSN243]|uniref:Uncharacterized protein n=1 Tax=Podospora aff. communis PSN243 TaxID=3040156 RepID=A0AAV9G754_9PEZI|nr:hypothetical protein QBC34DRAFT_442931 [Podospora aff. communis PSN243]